MSTKAQTTSDRKSKESNGKQQQNGKNMQEQQHGEQTLWTLLEKGLNDIYSAEMQLVQALPEVAQAADNEELEEAINTHLEETKKQVKRLDKVFERLGLEKDQSEECLAMKGLVDEARRTIQEFNRGPVRDAALIIGAQKIEHYEIASYGSLCELCDVIGEERLGDLLGKTLEEEEETDELLSEIAKDINDEAAEMAMHEEEEYR